MEGVNTPKTLRVSVATYNQVLFPHPENGTIMLALERKATVLENGSVNVRAQPFGGGVRILNPDPLKQILGEIRFDSERSQRDQDFRILIPPAKWGLVRRYCLEHLGHPHDPEIESAPDRELIEEFEETMQVALEATQYCVEALGFVVEDNPVWTNNWYARGYLTVRVYRIYKVRIVDVALFEFMLTAGQKYTDQDLETLALKDLQTGGRGKANSILILPLDKVVGAFSTLPPETRYRKLEVEGHYLDESVLAVLGEVEVPQYKKI
ncbi:MAG: hypothetical protein PVJ21_22910 [Anaerolineales bacterium]|jgi:hypothetical protein